MSASTPFIMSFAFYKAVMPVRLVISGSLTPYFASLTRENSRIARIVGPVFDKSHFLRVLRDKIWPAFVNISFPFDVAEDPNKKEEKKEN
jgi:hypothetical protein